MDDLIFANGVWADSGAYAAPPQPVDELARRITEQRQPRDEIAALKQRVRQLQSGNYGVAEALDGGDLASSGWGVIFPATADPSVRAALEPLLNLRRAQAGPRYRELIGATGYRPGERLSQFLSRQGVSVGPAHPDRLPYYLLIVGSPEAIPFSFQLQLDLQYAVGRLHFPTLEGYAAYAQAVVEAEGREPPADNKVVIFGPRHEGDRVSEGLYEGVLRPLHDELRAETGRKGNTLPGSTTLIKGVEATRLRLTTLLKDEEAPGLLVAAGHGAIFRELAAPAPAQHGALVCAEWPGPGDPLDAESMFAAGTLPLRMGMGGGVMLLLSAQSAGCAPPERDGSELAIQAPAAMVAPLASRLLSTPGGPLALIGCVDALWVAGSAETVAVSLLARPLGAACRALLRGEPVGSAMEHFNNSYAEAAVALSEELENLRFGKAMEPLALIELWVAQHNARSLCVIGDPAVRLAIAEPAAQRGVSKRPAVKGIPVQQQAVVLQSTQPTPGPEQTPPEPAQGMGPDESPTPLTEPEEVGQPTATPPTLGELSADVSYAAGAVGTGAQADFGVGQLFRGTGDGGEIRQQATQLLRELAERAANLSRLLLDESSALEVGTYTADDLSAVDVRRGDLSGARLLLLTRLNADGDTTHLVESEPGALPETLVRLHTESMRAALEHKTRSVESTARVLATLLGALQQERP